MQAKIYLLSRPARNEENVMKSAYQPESDEALENFEIHSSEIFGREKFLHERFINCVNQEIVLRLTVAALYSVCFCLYFSIFIFLGFSLSIIVHGSIGYDFFGVCFTLIFSRDYKHSHFCHAITQYTYVLTDRQMEKHRMVLLVATPSFR